MPSLNFKDIFAEPVKNGTKRQTIRQVRKNPIKPGDMLTMFTGQRTKECRKLCIHKCKSVEEIEIGLGSNGGMPVWDVKLSGMSISGEGVRFLSKADGFKSNRDFFEFFNSHYGPNFKGVLIKW